ncbi:dockerin type I domain-containing protein [Rhodopirellula europaea]|uniref:dockerin type I domain-containing protein n=1 Tax=Rhodopirellula europaea TaxID=1263866 RepID=UPI000586DBCC|nr:dockerin type I domain-containing protein [Rhodopirellula europaea]
MCRPILVFVAVLFTTQWTVATTFAQTGSQAASQGIFIPGEIVYFPTYDADGDGHIEIEEQGGDRGDALTIIDYLNFNDPSIPTPIHPGSDPLVTGGRSRYDVTGAQADFDQFSLASNSISALDALRIINFGNTNFHQNPTEATDVNGNGHTSALDALQVINYTGSSEPVYPPYSNLATAPDPSGPAGGYPFNLGWTLKQISQSTFLDVNGDNIVTSEDAQAVIDFLNANSN